MQAQADTGKHGEVVTFDLNADAAQAIQDGKIQFSVDQQPYVQGYMAVESLWLSLTNGNDIGGGKPVLTGPSFVDETNIDQILPYAQNNTRYRAPRGSRPCGRLPRAQHPLEQP